MKKILSNLLKSTKLITIVMVGIAWFFGNYNILFANSNLSPDITDHTEFITPLLSPAKKNNPNHPKLTQNLNSSNLNNSITSKAESNSSSSYSAPIIASRFEASGQVVTRSGIDNSKLLTPLYQIEKEANATHYRAPSFAKIDTGYSTYNPDGQDGIKSSIGSGKLLIPLYQTKEADRLVYTDLRGSFDDVGSSGYNVGIGFRQLINNGNFLNQPAWIIGAYGFRDRLYGDYGNKFEQTTIGFEALSNKYDFRVNLYIPDHKKYQHVYYSRTYNEYGFMARLERTTKEDYIEEKALRGADAEFGYKLPIKANTKLFAGYYYFDGNHEYKSVYGPRIRAEIKFDQDHLKFLPQALSITFGSEYQYDDVRGSRAAAILKLTYQFGKNYQNYIDSSSYHKDNLINRMNEFAVRDEVVIGKKNKISSRDWCDVNRSRRPGEAVDPRTCHWRDICEDGSWRDSHPEDIYVPGSAYFTPGGRCPEDPPPDLDFEIDESNGE